MPTPNNKMNNQYEEAREWYDANWLDVSSL